VPGGSGKGAFRSGSIATITTKGTWIMGEAKPWQIAVIVVGLLGFVGALAWSLTRGDGVEFAESITLGDVRTGEIVITPYDPTKSLVLPSPNPPNTELTLFPVYQEDGQWKVSPGFMAQLRTMKAAEATDMKTGVIKAAGEPKKRNLYKR
jgi:hypothetical protein